MAILDASIFHSTYTAIGSGLLQVLRHYNHGVNTEAGGQSIRHPRKAKTRSR